MTALHLELQTARILGRTGPSLGTSPCVFRVVTASHVRQEDALRSLLTAQALPLLNSWFPQGCDLSVEE